MERQHQYKPGVNAQVGALREGHVNAPPMVEGAGAGILRAAAALGGEVINVIAKDYAREMRGRMDDSILRTNAEFEKWKTEYKRTRQGVDALTAQKDFADKYMELANQAVADFGGNGNEIYIGDLKREYARYGLYAVKEGGAYQLAQDEAWQKSQWEAQLSSFRKIVDDNPDDADMLNMEARTLLQSWMAKNPGKDPGAIRDEIQSMLVNGRMQSLLEVGTEVSQEIVAIGAEKVGREYAAENIAAPSWGEIGARLRDTATQTLESVVIPVGIGGGISSLARRKAAASELEEIHEQERSFMEDAANLLSQSQVLREMPETGSQLVEALARDGIAPEYVYISPEAVQEYFFQEENEELMSAAAELGITPEGLQENLALGVDVAIPFGKAASGIFANQERYAALREDMRLTPETPTAADVEEAAGIGQDEAANAAFIEEWLAPLYQRQEEDANVQAARAEIAKPYVEQLIKAGWKESQAAQFGQVLAANAEQMAPLFNLTPQEYLAQTFAGYHKISRADFEAGRFAVEPGPDTGTNEAVSDTEANETVSENAPVVEEASTPENEAAGEEAAPVEEAETDPAVLDWLDGLEAADEETIAEAENVNRGEDIEEAGRRALYQEDLTEADKRLAEDIEAWEKRIDEFLQKEEERKQGKNVKEERKQIQVLSKTPLVLTLLGANKDLAIATTTGKLKKILINKHKLPVEVLKQVPKALTDPVMIFESASMKGDYVVMLDLKDEVGATVIVPVSLDYDGIGGYRINYVPSIYSQKDTESNTPRNYWFKKQIEVGNLRYFNNKKSREWAKSSGLQLPRVGSHPRSGKKKIYTEADLVKLREQYNNEYYQDGKFAARGVMATLPDGRHLVGLFETQNASTVLHETGHYFMEQLRKAHALANAPKWVKEAWGKLEKNYGFEDATVDEAGWVKVQERFARDFEAYAREGKAPSPELQTAFSRFRKWLTTIYKSIRSLLGTERLSEDVREVFDRLLATEEEIAESRRAMESDSAMNLPGIGEELRKKYAEAIEKARAKVEAILANKRLVEQRKAKRQFEKEAANEIDQDETYKKLAAMREKGISTEALSGLVIEPVAQDLRRKWRGDKGAGRALIRKGGTMDLMEAAVKLGFDNAQGLIGALWSMSTRREAIDGIVAQKMAAWENEHDDEIEYSRAYDEALAIELQALTGLPQLSPSALLRQMEERAGVRPLADVEAEYKELKTRLRREERLTRRAFNEARKETASDWRQRLADLKQRERIRRAALQAAHKTKMEAESIVRGLRKIEASKTIPFEFLQQIRAVMSHWEGLGTRGRALTSEEARSITPLDVFLAQMEATPFGEPLTVPQWLMDSLKNKTGSTGMRFDKLSLEQMRDVRSLVRELAQAGRNQNKMLAAKRKFDIQNIAEICAAQMELLSKRTYHSERDNLIARNFGHMREFLSDMTAIRFLARAMDGFRDHGVNHDSWFNPLQKARSRELAMRRKIYDRVKEAIMPLMADSAQLRKAFAIEDVVLPEDVAREWGNLWDMDKVISVALNMGNEGNINALMAGYSFSAADLQKITSRLTAEQWQAVQNIWDAIDSLYPELDAVYKELKGNPLPKVKAKAFIVTTADGQTIRMKGGYYPLVFDRRFSEKAAADQSVDELLNGMENIVRAPNPQSGMTEKRKGGKLPPTLSMSVLDRHITDTVHYICNALPLRDVNRLFNNKTFKDAFIDHAGLENYEKLLPWLRGLAHPGGERMAGPTRALQWLADRGATYALGGSSCAISPLNGRCRYF